MCWGIDVTRKDLDRALAALGYRIDDALSFNYVNNLNPGPSYPARSCYIVESDTGIGFAHYKDARRDENFRALQDFRFQPNPVIRGRVYEI